MNKIEFLNKASIKCNYLILAHLQKEFEFEKIESKVVEHSGEFYIHMGNIENTKIFLDSKLIITDIKIYSLDEAYSFQFDNIEVKKDKLFERYYLEKNVKESD